MMHEIQHIDIGLTFNNITKRFTVRKPIEPEQLCGMRHNPNWWCPLCKRKKISGKEKQIKDNSNKKMKFLLSR